MDCRVPIACVNPQQVADLAEELALQCDIDIGVVLCALSSVMATSVAQHMQRMLDRTDVAHFIAMRAILEDHVHTLDEILKSHHPVQVWALHTTHVMNAAGDAVTEAPRA